MDRWVIMENMAFLFLHLVIIIMHVMISMFNQCARDVVHVMIEQTPFSLLISP
jgi:uncharacterized MnhB-related membrane protein